MRVFSGREIPTLHGVDVVSDGPLHLGFDVAEPLGERRAALGEPQDVVHDEHLAVCLRARTDADG